MVNWIESNNVWLRYEEAGQGPHTVVLVHEMGGTLDSWDDIVPYLTPNYKVLRYDMRGFGMSEKIAGEFSLEDAVADLSGFLDALSVTGPVALVGCAVGAGICLRVAAARPDQVKALIAMAPATEIPPERAEAVRSFPQRLAEKGMRRFVLEDVAAKNYPPALQTDAARYRRFLAQQMSVDPNAFAATYLMLLTGRFRPYFAQINCPTLVVAGEFDPGRPPPVVKDVADSISGAEFKIVPSGHFMAVQTPELIGEMIADFLARSNF